MAGSTPIRDHMCSFLQTRRAAGLKAIHVNSPSSKLHGERAIACLREKPRPNLDRGRVSFPLGITDKISYLFPHASAKTDASRGC